MTADIRAKVYCNLGEVISGSFQESSSVGSGLITVEGSLLLSGPVAAPEGSLLELAYYDPTTNNIRRLGPKFKVISAVYNPGSRETTVIFADALGFLAEYETTTTLISSAEDANTADVQYDDMTEVQKAVLVKPMSAEYLAQEALQLLGLSGTVGTDMVFYDDEIKVDGNILGYVNDLAISANKAVYANSLNTVQSFSLLSATNSIVIPWDNVIDINPSGDGIRAASNIYITYNSKTLDFDADGLEDDGLSEDGVAYTLYNTSRGFSEDLQINYSYWDPDLGENVEETHQESVNINAWGFTKFDSESREIYDEQFQQGTYGLTTTKKTVEYTEGTAFGTYNDAYGFSARETNILKGIINLEDQITNQAYEEAFKRAVAADELDLYEDNPFGYTFGYNVKPEDVIADEAIVTRTYEVTTVEEPRAQFLSGAGCPQQAFDNEPLIPPTYRAAVDGTYLSSQTFTTTRESVAGTYTVEDVYEAVHKTQSGANQIAKILESARTTQDGQVVSWEEIQPSYLSSLPGIILQYGTNGLVHVSHRSEYKQKYFDLDQYTKDRLEGAEGLGAEDQNNSSAYSIVDTELVESLSAAETPGLNITYTPPFTSDDYIVRDGSNSFGPVYKVVKSNAAAEARAYGITQNRLRLAKAYSLSVVVPIKYYDPIPHRACSLEIDGVWGSYIIDSQSVAFDSNGILMSADLLLKGTVV